MAEKDNQDNQPKKRDANSLLSALLEETRRDAELELIQMEQEQNKKKQAEQKISADKEKERKKTYKQQLEAEKRKRAEALERFEERKRLKENPQLQQEAQTATKAPEPVKKIPVWAAVAGGILVLAVAGATGFMLTRPSNPPIVFNPQVPDGAGKAVNYAMSNIPFGPSAVKHGRELTVEQVILNTTPRPYIVKPKPKKVVKHVKHRKHHKKRVKIHVKLFSPGSLIK